MSWFGFEAACISQFAWLGSAEGSLVTICTTAMLGEFTAPSAAALGWFLLPLYHSFMLHISVFHKQFHITELNI